MNIAILEPLAISNERMGSYCNRLRAAGHTVTEYAQKTADPSELLQRTADNEIVVIANTPYPASVIKAAPRLKMIAVAFTGIDHVGLDACKQKGITVCNAAGYSTHAVAELAIGLTINLLRSIPIGDRDARSSRTFSAPIGSEIAGKTVGIIGTGAIGLLTAKLFQAFGAKVIAYSRTEKQKAIDIGISYLPLTDVLRQADIISLHVPATKETRGMIGEAELAMMKHTAVLINVARGAVVDNAALSEALQSGTIAAAGIDVFDMEPPIPADYTLLSAPNTVLTPHIAFSTRESMIRRAEIVFDNIDAYLAGDPRNVCKL